MSTPGVLEVVPCTSCLCCASDWQPAHELTGLLLAGDKGTSERSSFISYRGTYLNL